MPEGQLTWRFSREFWTANSVELLERAAYYGMFISLTLYLTNLIGFNDIEAGWISGVFAALLYFAPTISGAWADRIGFRKALALAFILLAIGYGMLGLFQTKPTTIMALAIIMVGGSFIKSVITGTVAKCSDEANRARAFSIFYQMVNIGSFSGKTLAKPLRTGLGIEYINIASALMCIAALVIILILYKNVDTTGVGKSFREIWQGLLKVVKNLRFMAIIIIVGGFWAIQHQLYATMPKYVLRTVGESASPEWYANVNPLVVILFVLPVTQLVRNLRPVQSIAIALFLIPFSSLTMSLSPSAVKIWGSSIPFLGFAIHPVTAVLIAGIALQGFAECFLSPRFLEYASKQAPPGETGLYMGYSHLNSFFGNLLGFGISGYLLNAWCPDPDKLSPEAHTAWQQAIANGTALPSQYAHAHYIWYVFAGIGFAAFLALLAFNVVTSLRDRQKARETKTG
ncbi:MAG: MFS transporter [Candidatus Eremiobacteraeota bacterium]|nr:MFS transporter [Candidatus Eremiobacteraeota bacterium]